MVWLWLWLAGVVVAWRPSARWLIRSFTFDGARDADLEDVGVAAFLGLLMAAGWPLVLAGLVARPFLARAAARINARRNDERSAP